MSGRGSGTLPQIEPPPIHLPDVNSGVIASRRRYDASDDSNMLLTWLKGRTFFSPRIVTSGS
jgi:hypothetical protein